MHYSEWAKKIAEHYGFVCITPDDHHVRSAGLGDKEKLPQRLSDITRDAVHYLHKEAADALKSAAEIVESKLQSSIVLFGSFRPRFTLWSGSHYPKNLKELKKQFYTLDSYKCYSDPVLLPKYEVTLSHARGVAIDIAIFGKDGARIAYPSFMGSDICNPNPTEVIANQFFLEVNKIMEKAGLVRSKREGWHYELASYQACPDNYPVITLQVARSKRFQKDLRMILSRQTVDLSALDIEESQGNDVEFDFSGNNPQVIVINLPNQERSIRSDNDHVVLKNEGAGKACKLGNPQVRAVNLPNQERSISSDNDHVLLEDDGAGKACTLGNPQVRAVNLRNQQRSISSDNDHVLLEDEDAGKACTLGNPQVRAVNLRNQQRSISSDNDHVLLEDEDAGKACTLGKLDISQQKWPDLRKDVATKLEDAIKIAAKAFGCTLILLDGGKHQDKKSVKEGSSSRGSSSFVCKSDKLAQDSPHSKGVAVDVAMLCNDEKKAFVPIPNLRQVGGANGFNAQDYDEYWANFLMLSTIMRCAGFECASLEEPWHYELQELDNPFNTDSINLQFAKKRNLDSVECTTQSKAMRTDHSGSHSLRANIVGSQSPEAESPLIASNGTNEKGALGSRKSKALAHNEERVGQTLGPSCISRTSPHFKGQSTIASNLGFIEDKCNSGSDVVDMICNGELLEIVDMQLSEVEFNTVFPMEYSTPDK